MTTLAVRNCNPLNIRTALIQWQGQTGKNEGFCVFKSPVYGFRAAAKIMHSYRREGITSVAAIVRRWAPPNENNTPAYVKAVCDGSGLNEDEIVVFSALPALIKAMAIHESGGWFFLDADVAAGIALA